MKKLSLLVAILLLSACGATELESPEEEQEQLEHSTLELAFVSGHFGSYYDCPEDAFSGQGDGAPERRAAEPDMGAVAGDCADEDCGGFLNCEAAQVTLQIENRADAGIRGIHVREIQVLDEDGKIAARLPVLSVDAVDMENYQGRLDAGQTATLRVEFQGPMHLRELLGSDTYRTPVRVIIEVEEQEPARLETPAIEQLGQIAT